MDTPLFFEANVYEPIEFTFRLVVWDGQALQVWKCCLDFPTSDIERNPMLGNKQAVMLAESMQIKVLKHGHFHCANVGCYATVDSERGGRLEVNWSRLLMDDENIELLARASPVCGKCKHV